MNKFREHKLEWDDVKVGRLWDYYSRTYPYNTTYFSEEHGGSVIKLFLKNNKKYNKIDVPLNIIDFGGGKGFMFDHCKKNI